MKDNDMVDGYVFDMIDGHVVKKRKAGEMKVGFSFYIKKANQFIEVQVDSVDKKDIKVKTKSTKEPITLTQNDVVYVRGN